MITEFTTILFLCSEHSISHHNCDCSSSWMYWYTFTAHYYIVVNVGVIDPDRGRGRLSSDIPLDASNVCTSLWTAWTQLCFESDGAPSPFSPAQPGVVHPVERFGVVDGELSQICLGNFRGSDSAAAIPWCETKFVLRHLSPYVGKGYLITGISCCTRLAPQTRLDIIWPTSIVSEPL